MSVEIRNKMVCVIGGAGFLGSHMVDFLINHRGCEVLVLDNLITGKKEWLHTEAVFEWHDIRSNQERLESLLDDHGVEFVFNYAAEPYIPECFERPMHFFDNNAVAVLRVLNACENVGIKKVLQVSSAEIYGDMVGKIKETDPIQPHSTYGVSKVAADGLVQVRHREAGVRAIALRQFNCVGPRETHEYVVPEIISQLASQADHIDRPPTIRLGNNSTRDFLYALDAVQYAVELLEKGNCGEVYNMGSEKPISIYELAKLISHQMGFKRDLEIVVDKNRVRPWEIWHLQSDNTKLWQAIGKKTPLSLAGAIKRTIEWYFENGRKWGFE